MRDYRIVAEREDGSSSAVVEDAGNYQRNRRHRVEREDITRLRVEVLQTNGLQWARLYAIRTIE